MILRFTLPNSGTTQKLVRSRSAHVTKLLKTKLTFPFVYIAVAAVSYLLLPSQQLFVANRCDFSNEYIRQRKLTFVSSYAFEMIQWQKQNNKNNV